MASVYSVNSR